MDVSDISKQLSEGKLTRGGMANRLRLLGLGFGAAFALGLGGAQAATQTDATVNLKSTNPVIDNIINSPQIPSASANKPVQTAWYRRHFFRTYHRFGFHRWYNRHYNRY
jgi:hypothetical protein